MSTFLKNLVENARSIGAAAVTILVDDAEKALEGLADVVEKSTHVELTTAHEKLTARAAKLQEDYDALFTLNQRQVDKIEALEAQAKQDAATIADMQRTIDGTMKDVADAASGQ